MGFFSSISQKRMSAPIVGANYQILASSDGEGRSDTGKIYTKEDALTVSSVHGSARIMAGTFGKLRINVNRIAADGTKSDDRKHWVWNLLNRQANTIQKTSQEFWRHQFLHTFLGGDSFAYKQYGAGRILEQLIPMHPSQVTVYQTIKPPFRVIYGYRPLDGGGEIYFLRDEIFHWPSLLSLDGVTGLGIVPYAATQIGLSKSQLEGASQSVKNSVKPSGVITYPKKLSDEQYDKIKKSVDDFHAGGKNAGRVLILHNESKWDSVNSYTNRDLELVAMTGMTVKDVSRFGGVPLFLLGEEESQSYGSSEMQDTAFLQYCMDAWVKDAGARAQVEFLEFSDRDELEIEWAVEDFILHSRESTTQYYEKGRQGGWLNPNDIRRKERLPLIPKEEGGDDFWRPANMVPASAPYVAPGANNQEKDQEDVNTDGKPTNKGNKPSNAGKTAAGSNRPKVKPRAKRTLQHGFGDAYERIRSRVALKFDGIKQKTKEDAKACRHLREYVRENRNTFREIIAPHVRAAFDFYGAELEQEFSEQQIELRIDQATDRLIDDALIPDSMAGSDLHLDQLLDVLEDNYAA